MSDDCFQASVDAVITDSQLPSVSASSQLEADSAMPLLPDTVGLQSSCEVIQTARTVPTVDLSVSDGLARRKERHRSGNLSIVSEESGPKSLYPGSFLV